MATRPDVVRSLVRIKTEIRAMEAEAGIDEGLGIGDLSDSEFREWMPEYSALRDALDALDAEATDEEWSEALDVLNAAGEAEVPS